MAFPPYGTTVPTLAAYQWSFQGTKFGLNTAMEILKVEGLDLPVVRSGDSGRPRDHGLFSGVDVMGGREINLEAEIFKNQGTTFAEMISAVGAATVPGGTVTYPLWINDAQFGQLVTYARVRKRNMPRTVEYTLGNLAKVQMQFVAPDPRLYSAPTQRASCTPPTSTSGFSFPFAFPLTFGGGGFAGVININNEGDIDCRPVLTIEGPCEHPSITLSSAANSPNLTFNLSMNAGDRLVLETDLQTATYYTSGSTIGSTRLYKLAAGSQWFTLPPGSNTIQFLSGTGEGTLYAEWASAYLI